MKKIYLFATIAAIIAGFATFWFANGIKESYKFVDVQKVSVVVAVSDISADTIITKEMLGVKSLPAEALSPNYVTDKSKLIGKMLQYPVYKGEQLSSKNVVTLEQSEGSTNANEEQNKMSYKLKKGEYAFTMEVNVITADGYYIRDNDFVNLIITNAKSADTTIDRKYENIRVLKVGTYPEVENAKASGTKLLSYSCVTLLVNKDQSLALTKAVNNGSIKMELVSYAQGIESKK